MHKKQTDRSSWCSTASSAATATEYAASGRSASLAVLAAQAQVATPWERQMLDEFAACLMRVATELTQGESWAIARCRALQHVVACATAAMLDIMAQATPATPGTRGMPGTHTAVTKIGAGWDAGNQWGCLTPDQHEVIRLHSLGWRAADIAVARHVQVSTVYTHLRNARQRLREGREHTEQVGRQILQHTEQSDSTEIELSYAVRCTSRSRRTHT